MSTKIIDLLKIVRISYFPCTDSPLPMPGRDNSDVQVKRDRYHRNLSLFDKKHIFELFFIAFRQVLFFRLESLFENMDNFKTNIQFLLKEKTDNIFVQLLRYTFVGGFAFIIDFGLLFLLTEYLHLHYILSATISFVAGLFANYIVSTIWVFDRNNARIKNRKLEFLYFSAIGMIGLGLNDLFIWLFTEYLHIYYMLYKIMVAVIVYLWNFLARKYFLFNKKQI